MGSFNPKEKYQNLLKSRTILLVGPNEPYFWEIFIKSEEYKDGESHPLDRWSKRVIEKIAIKENTQVYFPFDKNEIWPFYSWALECSEMSESPIKLLVHNKKGLFLSFRGAIGLDFKIKDKRKTEGVCKTCHKPCITSCPVSALTPKGYNVKKCKEYLVSTEGKECKKGCLVRRSCPFGSKLRLPKQSEFHMKEFIKS